MMPEFSIGNRKIGINHEPIVIAEIGINHGGRIDVAIEMADAAINAGAEIIKHQTHIVEDEMSNEAKSIIPGNAKEPIYDIIKKCALSESDEFKLMQHIHSRNIIFISTPFSKLAADRLIKFDIPAFKIGSGECNNFPLVDYISNFKKPMIISTGMNSIDSIRKTVNILEKKNIKYALLHCTNVYPTPPELVRLDAMKILEKEFPNAVIGLSDHTINNFTSLGSVSLGGSIIERHFTDSKDRIGPDISCSMDANDLEDLIFGAKTLFLARGNYKGPIKEEEACIKFAFASVIVSSNIQEGELISTKNIWVKRPGNGDFSADDYLSLIGKKAARDIQAGCQLKKEDIF